MFTFVSVRQTCCSVVHLLTGGTLLKTFVIVVDVQMLSRLFPVVF